MLAPGDVWWEGIENSYEVALEVSSHWRGQRIASELLAFALDFEAVEEMILFAMGVVLALGHARARTLNPSLSSNALEALCGAGFCRIPDDGAEYWHGPWQYSRSTYWQTC